MIPVELQDCLVKDFKAFLHDFYLKDVDGQPATFNIYPQYLPPKEGKDDKEHFPYIVVGLEDGDDSGKEEPNQCRIVMTVGVCDKDKTFQGYRDVLNVLQKLYDHLMRTQVFGSKFEINYPIKWALHDENRYPFFYGGLETNWTVGKITPADFD